MTQSHIIAPLSSRIKSLVHGHCFLVVGGGGGGGRIKNLMNTNGNEESMGRGGDLYRLATYDGLAMTHALF